LANNVAIDASSASSGGAVRYLSQICPALAQAAPSNSYFLLNRAGQRSQLQALPANFQWVQIPDSTASLPLRLLWLQVGLPRVLRSIGADVLFAASDVSTLRPPCPMVVMVHNFNPFSPLRGQIWSRRQLARMALHRRLIRAVAQRATKVVFVSEWSRQEMLPALNIPQEKSDVVYHGVDDIFRSFTKQAGAKNQPRFILAVSEVLEHKNFDRLVEAFIHLSKSQNEDLRLVIAGRISSEKLHRALEKRLASEGMSHRVKFLGFVPREELTVLYHQATLLIFPSLGETFGLPLIEAMASGLPVATSNLSAMPEICQDAARYFEPLDVAGISHTMDQLLNNQSLRKTLTQLGMKRSEEFSWSKSADKLLSIMAAVSEKTEAV